MPAEHVVGEVAPDLLTVEEAAAVLRIGRTSAYELARRWLATDGADGLPVQRIDGLLRVSRYRLEELIGGPVTWPPPGSVRKDHGQPAAAVASIDPAAVPALRRSRRNAAADTQSRLPFGA
jgi:hypothetical protein